MAYKNKLAAAIRVNNQVLRENNDTVYLPFNSEYQIRIKNLNTVRASVNVTVDGKNVLEGSLHVNPNEEIDLERFVTNGNLNEGNKFKFVERTNKVEKSRGIKLEDGLVQIEFQFEKLYIPPQVFPQPYPVIYPIPTPYYPPINPYRKNWYDTGYISQSSTSYSASNNTPAPSSGVMRGMCSPTGAQAEIHTMGAMQNVNVPTSVNDVGITVPGSHSDQQFVTTSFFALEEEKHTIILKLIGETSTTTVKEPITVKSKQKCTVCKHTNKITAKFCSNCGANLTIY